MTENIKSEGPHRKLIPLTTEEVTLDWFENIFNMKIDTDSYSVLGNANSGVGFLSNLVRVRFEESCADGEKKEHCLVVKLLPAQKTERELVVAEKMDLTELHFYQKLIPDILSEIPSLESFFCPFIYGDIQEADLGKGVPHGSVLILRDLKRDGYILKPFDSQEMTGEEIELTIDFLANFHAAGALIEMKKKTPLSEVYNIFPEWYYPNENKDREFVYQTWFIDGLKNANASFINYTKINPSAKSSGEEIFANLVEPFVPHGKKIINKLLAAGQQFPIAIHGDLWQNNLLIVPGSPPSVKIIDWQLTGYSDSVYDLAICLITSLHPHLNLKNLEKHTKMYFERLEKIYAQKENEGKDFSGRRRRSWEEFWQTMKTYGMAFAYLLCILQFEYFADFPDILRKVNLCFHFFHYEVGLSDFLHTLIK